MVVTAIGVGEAFDAVEPSACVLVEAEGFALLIDCGHAAVQAVWRAVPEAERIGAIYLTHAHTDHVLGLVPLLDRWASAGRRGSLALMASPEVLALLRSLFQLLRVRTGPDSPFPVSFLAAAETKTIGPFGIATAPTAHSIDNRAVALAQGGRRFACSGDGRPTAESRALYAGADLLFHECLVPAEAEGEPDHCDLPTVHSIGGPERIGLYHIRAGRRAAVKAAVRNDARLFVPEAGDRVAL